MQELAAKSRNIVGKKVKNRRKEGFLPGVLYGEKVQSQPIEVPYKDFEKVYKEAGESTLVSLKLNKQGESHKTDMSHKTGKPEESYNVLINDVSYDPVKGKPLHADFYAVRMDKEIKTRVPIEFFGESSAVKNESGILVKVMQEVEVEALPKDLPHGLRIDLSGLKTFEDRLTVQHLLLPTGVKILAEAGDIVALVEPPRSETELEELKKVEAAPEAVAEVKTEKEVKAEAKAKEEIEEEKEK